MQASIRAELFLRHFLSGFLALPFGETWTNSIAGVLNAAVRLSEKPESWLSKECQWLMPSLSLGSRSPPNLPLPAESTTLTPPAGIPPGCETRGKSTSDPSAMDSLKLDLANP
jgi:hypothetical protein